MGQHYNWESAQARPKHFGKLIGTSKASQTLYEKIIHHADKKSPIALIGSNGSGKTKAAQMLHDYSDRKPSIFYQIDSIDSQNYFFEHAQHRQIGTALIKKTASFCFDDLDKLKLMANNKNLRLILSASEKSKHFMEIKDHIKIPNLIERKQDIIDLAYAFLIHYKNKYNGVAEDFSSEILKLFQNYHWPDNIKELKILIKNMVIDNSEQILSILSLPGYLQKYYFEVSKNDLWQPLNLPLWQIEKRAIEQAISLCHGNIPQAAKLLDIAPSTIYRKMQSWDK